MSLISLKAVNFRNFDEIFLESSPGLNILLGPNGSGKTSILEAISYLCFSKSFRSNSDLDLLKEGKDFFQLKGLFKQK
ncbi:MAG: AAA family ATPase, partial [Candidatus Marinimicrobia bacterium]|nr:AAA family ATPase [Candidatus Neomarinimicrobiota bacterium]